LNPKRIESLKVKVCACLLSRSHLLKTVQQLDNVKDNKLIQRSTIERRSIYRSIRYEDPRYADSIVGSPDYMVCIPTRQFISNRTVLMHSHQAPEVLRGKPYTYSVDYWSLGCILFEFLAGFPPFSGSTPEETWTNLKNWTKVLRRPEYDKPEDLIFNLSDIAWDAVTRYGGTLHPIPFRSLWFP
jgi:serine/threonine protein kinase